MDSKVIFSFDIEADGQGPLSGSMIGLGIAVLNTSGVLLDSLEVAIERRPEAGSDPDTMEWCLKQHEMWQWATGPEAVSPKTAMWRVGKLYSKWSKTHKVEWMAQPACFDWMFLKSYYQAFVSVGAPDIGFSCTCFSTLRKKWLKDNGMPREEYNLLREPYVEGVEEDSHFPLQDAIFQGREYLGFLKFS